jgi:squalene synthase HpnC
MEPSSPSPAAFGAGQGAWTIVPVSVNHYENFPVASLLCPPGLRPAIAALYHYARTADDLADEGEVAPQQRLADLAAFRADLVAVRDQREVSTRWSHVFEPLRLAVARHRLPIEPLADLLSAFEQDIVKQRYADRTELLDYCRRSAEPVGRLLLHLYGVGGPEARRQSDAICTALQLANFWQDLGVDLRRDRLYIPLADCARHDVAVADLLTLHETAAVQALVAELVDWTRCLMRTGAPLVHSIRGRAGWELRLVVQGGLRILEKIEKQGYATLLRRPSLQASDAAPMIWRALGMRRPGIRVAGEAA